MPQAELGAGWKLERSKPLEVFEARALNGKPLMVFRQPAEAGTDPFWGGGWALWIDPDTGMAMRADGVTLSMLPDVRSVHVAECRNVVLEDVPDKVFAVPTEHVIWPPREGVKNP